MATELSEGLPSTDDAAFAHRAIVSTLFAMLIEKKVLKRLYVMERLKSLHESGLQTGMPAGALYEVELVARFVEAMLDAPPMRRPAGNA